MTWSGEGRTIVRALEPIKHKLAGSRILCAMSEVLTILLFAVDYSGAPQSLDGPALTGAPPYRFRNSRFRILPVPVFGRLSRNSTDWGHL